MARNRQRAKQRQAERRARRLASEGTNDQAIEDPTAVDPSPAVPPELAAGAPPTDEGRSDTVIEHEPPLTEDEPPLTEDEAYQEIEDWEVEDPEEAIKKTSAVMSVVGGKIVHDTGALK